MNDENLRTLSPSEAREYGRRGGVRSGEVRRERRRVRECLTEALGMETEFEGEIMTNAEAVSIALIRRAKEGNVAAFREIRDSTEGRPRQSIEVETISPEARAEVEAALFGFTESEGEDE